MESPLDHIGRATLPFQGSRFDVRPSSKDTFAVYDKGTGWYPVTAVSADEALDLLAELQGKWVPPRE